MKGEREECRDRSLSVRLVSRVAEESHLGGERCLKRFFFFFLKANLPNVSFLPWLLSSHIGSQLLLPVWRNYCSCGASECPFSLQMPKGKSRSQILASFMSTPPVFLFVCMLLASGRGLLFLGIFPLSLLNKQQLPKRPEVMGNKNIHLTASKSPHFGGYFIGLHNFIPGVSPMNKPGCKSHSSGVQRRPQPLLAFLPIKKSHVLQTEAEGKAGDAL